MLDDIAASRERYERFARRIAETGVVWALENEDGFANCSSNDDEEILVILFWSERALASKCAAHEWTGFKPVEIPLDLFREKWLTGMASDGVLVGPEWTGDLVGMEVDPIDLTDDLEQLLGENS